MKKLRKIITALAAVSGLLFAGPSQAMIELPNPSDYFGAAKSQPVKLLFTIETKHGVLRHLKDAKYELAVPLSDIKSVLAFSDRPNRLALRVAPQKFHDLVYSGDNNFAVNPPNVVLAWGDQSQPAEAYTITGYRKGHGMMTYMLTKLGKNALVSSSNKGSVSIFIDDETVDYTAGCPDMSTDEGIQCAGTKACADDPSGMACLLYGGALGYDLTHTS